MSCMHICFARANHDGIALHGQTPSLFGMATISGVQLDLGLASGPQKYERVNWNVSIRIKFYKVCYVLYVLINSPININIDITYQNK